MVQTPPLGLGVGAGGSFVPVATEQIVISVLPGVLGCRRLCPPSTPLAWQDVNPLQFILDSCPNGGRVQGGGGGEVSAPQDQDFLVRHWDSLPLGPDPISVDKLLKELDVLRDSGRTSAELLNGHLQQG